MLLFFVNASVFSIQGLGEDLGVFQLPFVANDKLGQVQFVILPEFSILNEAYDFRGIFWTNPFQLKVAVPVYRGFYFSAGNRERFNQTFDIYSENDGLRIHLMGRGGIEEVYGGINKLFSWGAVCARGSYLLGKSAEIWHYHISNYTLADTFTADYEGMIFSAGVRFKIIDIAYEFLGSLTHNNNTEIELPERLSIGLSPSFKKLKFSLLFEHSFWEDYSGPNRFKISVIKNNLSVGYAFNPWYLKGVQENRLDFSLNFPVKNVGFVNIGFASSLRIKDNIREFRFVPVMRFTIRELFARQRR